MSHLTPSKCWRELVCGKPSGVHLIDFSFNLDFLSICFRIGLACTSHMVAITGHTLIPIGIAAYLRRQTIRHYYLRRGCTRRSTGHSLACQHLRLASNLCFASIFAAIEFSSSDRNDIGVNLSLLRAGDGVSHLSAR